MLPNPPITPPNYQYFVPVSGGEDLWSVEEAQFPASVAMPQNAAIGIQITSNNTTGLKTLMGAENAAGADFFGILLQPILTTDADYATSGKTRKVLVPKSPRAKTYFAVGAGTLDSTAIGRTVEVHTDSLSLAVSTLGKGPRITGVIKEGAAGVGKGICEWPFAATETA